MHYELKLSDGSVKNLTFSLYFLDRFCKLSDMSLQNGIAHILGETIDEEKGLVKGGILGDLNIRANVVAAAIEAHGFGTNDFKVMTTVDGFDISGKVPNSLSSPIWGEIFGMVIKALVPDGLPKPEAAKKKAAPRKRR